MALTVDEELELIEILDAEEADNKKIVPPSKRDASFQRPEENRPSAFKESWKELFKPAGKIFDTLAIPGQLAKKALQPVGDFSERIADKTVTPFLESLSYQQRPEEKPGWLRTIENLPSSLAKHTPGAAAQAYTDFFLTPKAIEGVLKGTGKLAYNAKNFVSPSREYTIAKRTEALNDIINQYPNSKLYNAVDKMRRRGYNTSAEVSKTDLLNDVISKEGKINAKPKLEAFHESVKPVASVVNDVLAKEGVSLPPEEIYSLVDRYLKKRSGLSGKSLLESQSRLAKEIEGMKLRANMAGEIPLTEVHKAKTQGYKDVDYNNELSGEITKEVMRGLERIISGKSSKPVRQLNSELSKIYSVEELLRNLTGKTVKGGKAGKYFNQMLYGLAGSKFGPLGTILGGKLGELVKGYEMANKLGKVEGAFNIPESLYAAKSAAMQPRPIAGLLPSKTGISIPGAIQQPTNLEYINSALSNLENTKVPVNVKDVINYDNPYASIAPRLALPSPETVSTAVPRINQYTNLEEINQALENLKRTNITPKIKTKLDYGNRYADVYPRLGLPSPENVSTTLPPINQFTNLEFINEALNNLKKAKVSGVKDVVNKKQALTEAEKNFQRFLEEMKNFRTTNLIA